MLRHMLKYPATYLTNSMLLLLVMFVVIAPEVPFWGWGR